MKTYSAKPNEVPKNWLLIDAEGQTLGRMATAIATRLRGKHKAEYTPHVDTGDYVVVINADKVQVTGNKTTDKIYHAHSGFPGGLKSISFDKLRDKAPERVIKLAVKACCHGLRWAGQCSKNSRFMRDLSIRMALNSRKPCNSNRLIKHPWQALNITGPDVARPLQPAYS